MSFWDMITGNSAIQAANAQNQGAQQAMGALNQSYGQAQQYQQPYYQQGIQSLSQLAQGLQGGQYSTTPYNPSNFNFQADPGYQWQLQQGNNAIQSNAAAGGIQLSGATLKALQKYGQGLANKTYNQAFDRFNTGAMNQYNTSSQQAQQRFVNTAQLAGYGQSAANNISTMASNQGQSLASTYGPYDMEGPRPPCSLHACVPWGDGRHHQWDSEGHAYALDRSVMRRAWAGARSRRDTSTRATANQAS